MGFLKILPLLAGAMSLMLGCTTRYHGTCEPSSEYEGKSVASIMADSRKIIQDGKEKRAVTFGVFGSKKLYTEGALENILLAKELYPTWDVVLFVHPDSTPPEFREEARKRGARLVEDSSYNHASARFYVADLDYDRFIVRDADSRIYPREVAAVADWIKKDWAIVHGMHDAPNQTDVLLGGMWGAVVPKLREKLQARYGKSKMEDLYKGFMNGKKAVYGDDQRFLEEVVVGSVGYEAFLSHESFTCQRFVHSEGFPIPRGTAGIHIGGIRKVD